MDNQTPTSNPTSPTENIPAENPAVETPPQVYTAPHIDNPPAKKPFLSSKIVLLIVILLILLGAGGTYLALNSKPKPSPIVSKASPTSTPTPTPTCRPRPACLDATPRCLIPETSDMCPKAVVCAQDAKLCPDGKTYVGRQGLNCEFAPCLGQ